ncbi:MAG TPA: ATP-binding cassette domain-containing protein [Saprospiraceae bacterium]|nr:ATP-binding cassette domain-containing protein [Saprospiraceae bacterium]HMQ83525.1 ATP-binding cassette domain-containing protein [Saprospiraceae bacterium]
MKNKKGKISVPYLLKALLNYKKGVFQLIILQILWLLIELATPFLTKSLVDKGIKYQDYHFVVLVLLAQLMLFVGYLSSDFFKSWILRHIGIRLNTQLLNGFLHTLLYKNILFLSKQKEGEIGQLITDNFRVEKFLTDSLSGFMDAFLKVLLYGVILSIFNTTIALLFVASILLSLIWDFLFLKERARVDQLRFSSTSQVRNELLDVISGIQDIKVNNLEAHRQQRWGKTQHVFSNARLNVLRVVQLYKGGTLSFDQIRDIVIIFFAATLSMKGRITLGELLAIQYILGQLNKQTFILMQFIQDYHDAKLSLSRLETIMGNHEMEPSVKSLPSGMPLKGMLALNNLSFKYDQTYSLKEIELLIPYGSTVAIVGESGSGKSTLLKLILKLIQPMNGSITIEGKPFDHIKTEDWLDNCGIVLQDGYIFPDTLLYNITFCNDQNQADMDLLEKSIQLSCLQEIIVDLKEGVHTLIGRGGKQFSKGQEQRILIARAIYKSGNFLIMDEPTSALDTITERSIFDNLTAHYAGKSIIFTTHKLRMTKLVDIIVVIDGGRIVEIGKYEELVALEGKYFNLFVN